MYLVRCLVTRLKVVGFCKTTVRISRATAARILIVFEDAGDTFRLFRFLSMSFEKGASLIGDVSEGGLLQNCRFSAIYLVN